MRRSIEPSSVLISQLKKIIGGTIHQYKCDANLSDEQWKKLPFPLMADEILIQIVEMLKLWAYIPCCHTSGMHDPEHFDKRKYICESQLAAAFRRFCKDLGINPITRSDPDCGWCREYLHYRKGEGLKLFDPKREKEKQ